MVICLERGADLHTAQLMPMPLTVSCFSKIQIGFTFLVPAYPGSPGQRAVKRVCVASAGPYANHLHLTPDRQGISSTTQPEMFGACSIIPALFKILLCCSLLTLLWQQQRLCNIK